MIKKILISLVILAIIFFALAYIYRQVIVQHYGEKFIRDNLPGYISIDVIKFDLGNNVFSIRGLKILNPPGYLAKYSLAIEEVRCVYRARGGIVPKGLDIREISFKRPEIAVERLPDEKINLVEMRDFIGTFPTVILPTVEISQPATQALPAVETLPGESKARDNTKKLSGLIKVPSDFSIKGGRIYFIDSVPYSKPYEMFIDSVSGKVSVSFNDSYTAILSLAFTLEGDLNGKADETIKWIASLDPSAPKLSMSNRFEVSNLDILTFEPYYDAQSPVVFKKGEFSGELVFDFSDGNIGSTNEVRLSDVEFWVKPGYEDAQFWDTSVPDLVRYFTSSSGDIIFDFRIKGDMASPKFYLGPISKRALTSMAIDKISSYAIKQITKKTGAAANGTVDKAKDYIDMFKGLIEKN